MDAAPQHITASRSNVDTGVLSPDVTLMNKDTYKDAVLSTNCFSVLQRLNSSALLVSLRHTSRRTRWIISILLALTIILIVTVLSVLLSRGTVSAVGSIVNLSYGSYQGVPLSNGITQWLGLRYAAPPIGNLRFASPTDPVPFDGIKIANKVNSMERNLTNINGFHRLDLDVWALVPPSITKRSLKTVSFSTCTHLHLRTRIQNCLSLSGYRVAVSTAMVDIKM